MIHGSIHSSSRELSPSLDFFLHAQTCIYQPRTLTPATSNWTQINFSHRGIFFQVPQVHLRRQHLLLRRVQLRVRPHCLRGSEGCALGHLNHMLFGGRSVSRWVDAVVDTKLDPISTKTNAAEEQPPQHVNKNERKQ